MQRPIQGGVANWRDGLIIVRNEVVPEEFRVVPLRHPEEKMTRVILDDVAWLESGSHRPRGEEQTECECRSQPELICPNCADELTFRSSPDQLARSGRQTGFGWGS